MRRVLAVLVIAGIGGCGSASVQPHALRAWPDQPPYFPPPEPSNAVHGTRSAPRPATTAAAPARPAQPARPPSDAEVARELQQAFGAGSGAGARALVDRASVTSDGLATVPPAAPPQVAAIITAANQVARKPYVYGGGHGRLAGETWIDTAYDCSGSVSFALANAGLIDAPMDSTALSRFGRPGAGRWVTIYANGGHAWMTVAGLRFDTPGLQSAGSRWQASGRSVAGFVLRHPTGL